jgi:hypothetical protein
MLTANLKFRAKKIFLCDVLDKKYNNLAIPILEAPFAENKLIQLCPD